MVSKYVKYAKTMDIRTLQNQSFCGKLLIITHSSTLRVTLAKFRVGNHDLDIEKGRYVKVPVDERFCKLCLTLNENHIENEYHVLLKCPFYKDLRKIYLCFNNGPLNLHTFINIMCTQNQEEIVQLGCFVSSMFKLRYYYLQSV